MYSHLSQEHGRRLASDAALRAKREQKAAAFCRLQGALWHDVHAPAGQRNRRTPAANLLHVCRLFFSSQSCAFSWWPARHSVMSARVPMFITTRGGGDAFGEVCAGLRRPHDQLPRWRRFGQEEAPPDGEACRHHGDSVAGHSWQLLNRLCLYPAALFDSRHDGFSVTVGLVLKLWVSSAPVAPISFNTVLAHGALQLRLDR